MEKYKVDWQRLNSFCSMDTFAFDTTKDLKPLKGIIGQDRAAKSLEFGLKMKKKGYNIYISGLSGTGRSSYSESIARSYAESMQTPQAGYMSTILNTLINQRL